MLSTLTLWCSISTTLLLYVHSSSALASNACQFYCNATHRCESGFHRNKPLDMAEIIQGSCATSSGEEGVYYYGSCPFTHTINSTNRMYSELLNDPDQLNDAMCGPYNRRGLLCGRCIDGYGPTVNPLDMKCADCSKFATGYAIILHLLLEFIPITLFFIFVIIFRINLTTGPLLSYVIFCQLLAIGSERGMYITGYILSHVSSPLRFVFHSSLALCHFWSLNFAITSFCISEHLTGIHIQMLRLATVTYPILLVIITCILMELHARNYRVIHVLWKPFGIILNKTNTTRFTSDSVIHGFATLIFLSNITPLHVVFRVFKRNTVYRGAELSFYKYVLFIDPTLDWLNHEHAQYILVTIILFLCLTLLPSLLLCVYPTRIYGYLSRFINARKRLAITAFVEALHNCFKDGLNGTRDYRALAGFFPFYLLLYMALRHVIMAGGYHSEIAATMVSCCIVSYIKPFKQPLANLSLSYHHMVFGILSVAYTLWEDDLSTGTETLELTIIIIPIISHVLIFMWIGYTITQRIFAHPQCQLSRLLISLKRYFHGRHDGYQELN